MLISIYLQNRGLHSSLFDQTTLFLQDFFWNYWSLNHTLENTNLQALINIYLIFLILHSCHNFFTQNTLYYWNIFFRLSSVTYPTFNARTKHICSMGVYSTLTCSNSLTVNTIKIVIGKATFVLMSSKKGNIIMNKLMYLYLLTNCFN